MRPYLLIIISYRKPPLPHQTRPHQTNTKKTVQKSAEISKQFQTPPPSIHLILHHLQHAKQTQLGTEADLLRFELEFLMGEADSERKQVDASLHGLFSVSSPRFLWKSRRRRASTKTNPEDVAKLTDGSSLATPEKLERSPVEEQMPMDSTPVASVLSEKRKALFEPLDPATSKRASAETLLPPPDFDSAIYPKGWLIGKKRKLVNVDVVESMRRIAVQEMNRKDREIDGLNEQLEEDSRCLEHLQIQLLEEKRKRSEVERENNMLQEQLNMLMNVLQENEAMDEKLRILRQMSKSHSHSLSLFRCRLVYVTGKGKGKETNLDIFYL